MKKSKPEEPKFMWAYDPEVDNNVIHAIKGGYVISIVTGHKFKFTEENVKKYYPKFDWSQYL